MARNPYEWLYAVEAQPLRDYVLDEVAKYLARAVEQFPPSIEEWERPDLQARFAPLLAAHPERPRIGVIRVALQLYRWELERDVEAIDQFMRNEGWQAERLTPVELEVATFLWQYWLDQTLAFKEYAAGKFKWHELTGLHDRLLSRLAHQTSPLRA